MKAIIPYLWFDLQASEAVEFYTQIFDKSKITQSQILENTPSGDTPLLNFELEGQSFMAINGGPYFTFNPSISFIVLSRTNTEINQLFNKLISGGKVLMPLDTYSFSERFAWLEDKFGVTWQLLKQDSEVSQKIVPFLLFSKEVSGKTEKAVRYYVDIFSYSSIQTLEYYEDEKEKGDKKVRFAHFKLNNTDFMAMDSLETDNFTFNEAISLLLLCETQEEVDYYWKRLSAVSEAEECGWLKDKFGISWQVVPEQMTRFLSTGTTEQINQVTQALLKMEKLDITVLEKVWQQAK